MTRVERDRRRSGGDRHRSLLAARDPEPKPEVGTISNSRRGDMPFGEPFGEHPLRSSQLGVAQLGHPHGQGIPPHFFRATIEAREGPQSITLLRG
jgi:hypothetical protein